MTNVTEYSKTLEALKFDASMQDEGILRELDDAMGEPVKKESVGSEDDAEDFDDADDELEEVAVAVQEEEAEYVESLKSSIYSESFQRELLKKLLSAKKQLDAGKEKYLDIVSDMIMNVKFMMEKSGLRKKDSAEDAFSALLKLLEGIVSEPRDVAGGIVVETIKALESNIEQIVETNKAKKEIIEITLSAQKGNDADKAKVIEYMSKDLEKYARKITSFNVGKNASDATLFDDLYQEGLIGILKGIQKYTPKKSDNVREYMKFWINQSMLSYVMNKVQTIRIPSHVRQMYAKVTKMVDKLAGQNEDQSIKNVAQMLGLDETKVRNALDRGKVGNVLNMSDLNLGGYGDDQELSIDNMPFMADDSMSIQTSMLESEDLRELQETIKMTLNPEERLVIIHRFGLFGADKLLLKDLGEKLGKTEERIRQIENRAIDILSIRYFEKKYGKGFREILKGKSR